MFVRIYIAADFRYGWSISDSLVMPASENLHNKRHWLPGSTLG
jgi:hypothetical protein